MLLKFLPTVTCAQDTTLSMPLEPPIRQSRGLLVTVSEGFFSLSVILEAECLADPGKDRGLEVNSGRPEPINQIDAAIGALGV